MVEKYQTPKFEKIKKINEPNKLKINRFFVFTLSEILKNKYAIKNNGK